MKALKLILLALFLISCRQDLDETNIIGTWKLTAQLSDPGDGSGKFLPVNSNRTVTFKKNGTYVSNGSFCYMNTEANQNSDGTYVYSSAEKTLNTICVTTGFTLPPVNKINIENGNLIVYYDCIEPCAQKFTKIKD